MNNESNRENYIKKLKIIIPYWIEHNNEHIGDHGKWLKDAEKFELKEVASELRKAIALLKQANEHIKLAYKKLNKNA